MSRFIVTGGLGFIGSNFIRLILNENLCDAVLNIDKQTYAGNPENLSGLDEDPRYEFIKTDIGDEEVVSKSLIDFRPTSIINFAAESHVDRSIDSPEPFVETNVLGTLRLLQCTKNFFSDLNQEEKSKFRFLHVSTDEVYGSLSNTDPAFSETTSYSPNSPYSASKAGADHLVRSYHHTFGIPTLTTNCSNIRDWLHVEDHCRGILAVLDKGRVGETYCIGGDSEKTNLEVVDTICEALDRDRPENAPHQNLKTFVKDRPGHDRRYAIDFSKIQNELGWEPRFSFEEGMAQTVDWYLTHSEWCDNVTSGKYQRERLGSDE